jgi:hypothetical protein
VTLDDCRIIERVLNTRTSNPLSFASFGAACDWRALNLSVKTTQATEGWRTFFTKPIYNSEKSKGTVSYSDSFTGTNNMYGSHAFRCDLEKQKTQWQITKCVAAFIAN